MDSPSDVDDNPNSFVRLTIVNSASIDEDTGAEELPPTVIPHPVEEFLKIKITPNEWRLNLQDSGCTDVELVNKRYKGSKIISVGPKGGDQLFYYGITSIAVDYVKEMVKQKKNGVAWFKLPVSLPNVKNKIVEVILQLRILEGNNYELEQTRLINFLHNIWGNDQGGISPNDNDKVRLFGLIMTLEKNRLKFQRLAEGHKDWHGMDDPTMSLANIFRCICFDFANEDIVIDLPDNACDIQGIEGLDPNDRNRMKIERDGMNCICLLFYVFTKIHTHYLYTTLYTGKFFQTLYATTMTEYKALLHLWHKGTGGGPGLDIYFESWSEEKN